MRTLTLAVLLSIALSSTAQGRKIKHPPAGEIAARNATLIERIAPETGEPPWQHIAWWTHQVRSIHLFQSQ
ncbi:MAG: hypothetical protein ACE366_23860 [Bradymonadia bacterium]